MVRKQLEKCLVTGPRSWSESVKQRVVGRSRDSVVTQVHTRAWHWCRVRLQGPQAALLCRLELLWEGLSPGFPTTGPHDEPELGSATAASPRPSSLSR